LKNQFINEFIELVKSNNYTIENLISKGCIGEKEMERALITRKFKSMRKHGTYECTITDCSIYFGVSEGKIRNVIREHSIEL